MENKTRSNSIHFSLDAEQSVIGGLLLDNSTLDIVLEQLSSPDFYDKRHQLIFDTILTLNFSKKPFDLLTMEESLKEKNCSAIIPMHYLYELANRVPSVANIASYAQIVKEKSIRRQLLRIYKEGIVLAENRQQNITDLLEFSQKKVFELSMGTTLRNAVALSASVKAIYDKLSTGEKSFGLPTGFKDFDELTSGLHPSDLIIIGARPSMGKTSLAMNIAEHVGLKQQKNVLVFSLEMCTEQISMRLLSSKAHISYKKLQNNELKSDDWKKISEAVCSLQRGHIFIHDESLMTPAQLRTKARKAFKKHNGLDLIIIDYLQKLYEPSIKNNKTQEITAIVTALKNLAKELNIPVIALSQLNRALENRTDKRPTLSDLRESGGIEQEADVVAFIYRDEFYNPSNLNRGVAELNIAKNRNGACGSVKLKFFSAFTQFESF